WLGTTSGLGNITINNNPTGVQADAGTLTFGGATQLIAGGGSLLKTGTGTLVLGGDTTNTYTGNTYVQAGTLVLNKTAATTAIPGGEVMVGDNAGGDNADVLQYAS